MVPKRITAGTHLAELGGIVPLGGDHFTPLGVDIAATRLHTLEIHAVEVGIERRQPVIEPADAFIAERADLTAVAVDEPEIDIVVAHHGHPAREGPRHGETGRNSHIPLDIDIPVIAELLQPERCEPLARGVEVVIAARDRLVPQRVDKSPLAAVGLVAQHHAAAVVRPA